MNPSQTASPRRAAARAAALATWITIVAAPTAGAQVAWDAPYLGSPRPGTGLGLYLVETAGGDLGVMSTWQSSTRPGALGWRLGIADDAGDALAVFGGLGTAGRWHRADAELPLDIGWVAGAGIGVGHHALISLPVGITAGRTITGEGPARFTPYLSPRLILDGYIGGHAPGDGDEHLDLDLALDIGLDVAFDNRWVARFGATVGDREGLAIGIVF
ncbi:MAG: hypothetical protein PVF43_07895 [Candidatus Eiseniibacteriota bacterium]